MRPESGPYYFLLTDVPGAQTRLDASSRFERAHVKSA
jgi:hypothetical protein